MIKKIESNIHNMHDDIIKQIKEKCKNDKTLKQDANMIYAQYLIKNEDYSRAIKILEMIADEFETAPLQNVFQSDYYNVINILFFLYFYQEDYQKSADLGIILIDILLENHIKKYGEMITKDNMDFEEIIKDEIVSKCLSVGASLSNNGQYFEAREYLELGYFIAVINYGDEDQRTLKLNYNLALNEIIGIDYHEGIRQLGYVYGDMKKYLGEENLCTIKAKHALNEFDKKIY